MPPDPRTSALYLSDLGFLLTERWEKARRRSKSEFDEGVCFGLMQAVSLMQHQADAFDLARSDLRLPDRDVDTIG